MAGAAACSQDFFISHSWSDDATLKYAKLQQVADEFEAENGRPPTFWLDKVCIDQSAIGDALRVNGALTSLDLRWNKLGDREAALREIAKDRPSLTLKL